MAHGRALLDIMQTESNPLGYRAIGLKFLPTELSKMTTSLDYCMQTTHKTFNQTESRILIGPWGHCYCIKGG